MQSRRQTSKAADFALVFVFRVVGWQELTQRDNKSGALSMLRSINIAGEFFTQADAERKLSHLSIVDRIEIRSAVQEAVRGMREAEHTRVPARRVQLARMSLEQLIVATATAVLKARSSIPIDWPDLAQAIRVVAELPAFSRHQSALSCVVGANYVTILAERQFELMADFFGYLEAQIDTRTARDFQLSRASRVAGLCVLLFCGGWVIVTPRNVALGKQVRASSLCGDMPAPPVGEPKLFRVVDGNRFEARYAACTGKDVAPWISIDLGSPRSISEVVIFPRTDSYWMIDELLPTQIQLSLDGEHFKTEGTRTMPITPDIPWRLKVRNQKARYVRYIGGSNKPQELLVSEIEVYGH